MSKRINFLIGFMLVIGIAGAALIFSFGKKEPTKKVEAVTLRSTIGKIIAVGPRYVTVENVPGKTTSLEFVTNLDPIRTKAEDFLRKQQKVVIVYRTKSISQYENETAIDSLTPNP